MHPHPPAEAHDDPALVRMMSDMRSAAPLFHPSPFWERLIEQQIVQIREEGVAHFKRTVNLRYFSWDLKWLLVQQCIPMLVAWVRNPERHILSTRVQAGDAEEPFFGPVTGRLYGVAVGMLCHLVAERDPMALLERLEEPLVGDPLYILREGRRISQDLCNSVHEFYASTEGLAAPLPHGLEVVELGAGYGRLAFVFLHAAPACKYTIVDIPPALYVSQKYLTTVFPDKRVFTYRAFTSFEEVRGEFDAADVRLLAAHQISLLPDGYADLFLNISSLGEMTWEQIQFYFDQAGRLTRGFFYTKQWLRSRAPGNAFSVSQHGYPVPEHWRTIYHRHHPIQQAFFHALYEVGSGSGLGPTRRRAALRAAS